MRVLDVVIVSWMAACSSPSADDTGDASGADANGADANPVRSADASPSADANIALCQPDKLRFLIGDRPLVMGDYCDDIQLCAANAEVAAEIIAILPGFSCMDGGCAPGEISCQWSDPDDLDSDEYANLCLLTVIDKAPEQVTCSLYL